MSKKKYTKLLAAAWCATTMASFYAAPVYAGEVIVSGITAGTGTTTISGSAIASAIGGETIPQLTVNKLILDGVTLDSAALSKAADFTVENTLTVGGQELTAAKIQGYDQAVTDVATNKSNITTLGEKLTNVSYSSSTGTTVDGVVMNNGKITANNGAVIYNGATINGVLGVNGNATVSGTLISNGGLGAGTNGTEFTVNPDGSVSAASGKFSVSGDGTVSVDSNKFSIAGSTGNTNVGGTLYVKGETALNDKLTVNKNGAAITGDTTVTGAFTAGPNNEFKVETGNVIAKGQISITDLSGSQSVALTLDKVNGYDTTVTNTGGIERTSGSTYYTTIEGKVKVGDDGTVMINEGDTNQVKIDADGLHVGTTSTHMATDGVYAGGTDYASAKAAIATDGKIKGAEGKFEIAADGSMKAADGNFTVDAAGNTAVSGALEVTGESTFTGKLTANDGAEINNGLTVNGATTLNDKLTVTSGGAEINGDTTIKGALGAGANGTEFTVDAAGKVVAKGGLSVGDADQFTVDAATGNIVSKGSITATNGGNIGGVTFDNAKNVTGINSLTAQTINANTLNVASFNTTGDMSVGGKLTVTGAIQGATINGATIDATHFNGVTLDGGNVTATDVNASNVTATGTINGASITGTTFNGVAIGNDEVNGVFIKNGNVLATQVVADRIGVNNSTFMDHNGLEVGAKDSTAPSFKVDAATGDVTTTGKINGVDVTALSEGFEKANANVAGITRPRENETIIEGKVAINSVGNIYTPGSIIAENGFSTGNGNFAVSGATGDITTKGAINGVSLSESGIKFGKDGKTQILASVTGDAIINGNTIGFDGINASGGLSVGVLDKKFGVDKDGNIESQGSLSVADGKFAVAKDGTVTSKVGNSTLYVGADQVGIKNGNNAVVVDNNGVLLGNAFGSNVRVGENGVTFNNGEAGFTTINGGNISNGKFSVDKDGNISNGKFSVDKDGNIQATTYNGIDIEKLKSDVETSNKNVAGIERSESAAGDGYVTEIEGKTMIASDGTFSTATGQFVVGADGSIASQFADDGALVANKDGFAVAKGANSVNVNEYGVGLAAGADNQVSVTKDGIGLQAGTSQVIMNSKNGIVFRNGDKDANGETVINGGNITATGTINGATITDKAFNGVEIGNGLVDGVDVSELKGSFDKANENVAGITRKDGNTNIEGVLTVSANGLNAVKDNSAIDLNKDGAFLTSNGNMVFANANAAGLMADENNFISVSKNGIGLKGNVVFDYKNGSVTLGKFYDEYRTNVEKFDKAIEDLQDKTQNIDKNNTEDGHTQIDGDLTVGDVNVGSGNINTGNVNAGNVNAGTVNADNVVVGDTTINKDGITSNKVTVGDTTIDKDGITSNKVTVGDTTVSKDSVNVGGENGTTVSKDGVTVGGENGTSVSKDDVVINKGTDKEVSLSNVGSRVDNLEQGLADANSRIDRVDEKIDKVGAMAAAIANLRTMGYDPEAPTEIAVGVGQYRSETGAALGFFHYPNRDFMLSMSVSTSGDEVMGGIGATWKFGRKTPAEMKAAKERAAEKAKLEKAAAIKKAAELAKVEKQQQRHAELAAKKAAK